MATAERGAQDSLRRFFRVFNRAVMLTMWRLGLGRMMGGGPEILGRYMVLAHTGRRSGARRLTPLNFAQVDGDVYCAAGFGAASDWVRNIRATPEVEVWLPGGRYAGRAEVVPHQGDAAALQLMRAVLRASGFAGRLAGFDADRITSEALARATEGYLLVRIRLGAARTGPGGPGELAWLWPAAALVAWLLLPRRRPR